MHAEHGQVVMALWYLQDTKAPPPPPSFYDSLPHYCNKNILCICELGVECKVKVVHRILLLQYFGWYRFFLKLRSLCHYGQEELADIFGRRGMSVIDGHWQTAVIVQVTEYTPSKIWCFLEIQQRSLWFMMRSSFNLPSSEDFQWTFSKTRKRFGDKMSGNMLTLL